MASFSYYRKTNHGGIFMQYENLKELLYNSKSSRNYFYSLSAKRQMEIHKYNNNLHTLFELKSLNEAINKYNKQLLISNSLFQNYNP